MESLIHAIQLEAAYQWYHANASDEARRNLSTRARWFEAMKRINSTICDQSIEV